jgi:hypothetical protein
MPWANNNGEGLPWKESLFSKQFQDFQGREGGSARGVENLDMHVLAVARFAGVHAGVAAAADYGARSDYGARPYGDRA